MADTLDLYRHTLAATAYRFQKAVYGAKANYPEFEVGQGVRKPIDIIHHMTMVLEYAKSMLTDTERQRPDRLNWQGEIDRFHLTLADLDQILINRNFELSVLKKVLQGPLSDVLTHVGQLATLRRLSGDPIPGESYVKATIETGKVDKDQPIKH